MCVLGRGRGGRGVAERVCGRVRVVFVCERVRERECVRESA